LCAFISPGFAHRWLNAQLFVTDFRPVPLQSFLKQVGRMQGRAQGAATATCASSQSGYCPVRYQPTSTLPSAICQQLLPVPKHLPELAPRFAAHSLLQGLCLKGEDMEVVRKLEVPPGWDTSKNGVSAVGACA
jgi:hypothetical protein